MEDYLKKLNEAQKEAVTSTSQYLRIIAGAGSGKTRVLTTRIAYLINEWGIAPESILAITFTNKAANEMKLRIEKMLSLNSYGAHISTIHSFCVTFLRQEIRRENYPTNFTILDGDDQKAIIKEAYKALNLDSKDYNTAYCLNYIGNMKAAGFDCKHALDISNNIRQENLAKIYQFYSDRCHQLYGLDFDDLIIWTTKILEKYPQVANKWQQKFHFILVDEFQDIDDQQYKLINLLSNENTYLYVVGDPDQTIYSWRGANINIIMDFIKKYKNCKTILLKENYRSTKNILNGANSLIKYNKHRVEKDLFTSNEDGTKIIHFTAGSDESEANYVVKKILDNVNSENTYKDFAILYRNNYLSRNVEKALSSSRIPYVIYGGVRFYERKEIKDILSYLRLITNGDDLSFKRVVNVPKRSIGDKSVDRLFEIAREKNTSIMNVINDFDGLEKTKDKLIEFKKMIEKWRQYLNDMSLSDLFNKVLDETGYRVMLETSNEVTDEERLDNLQALQSDIIDYITNHPQASLDEYLANVALYTDVQTAKNGDFVSLMTIHASKGLEFNNVFVIGMSETIFPSAKSCEESGIYGLEEERRLAYVAFTRARKNLVLTDSQDFNFSTGSSKQTSRFIDEIDEQFISITGMNNKTTTITQSEIVKPNTATNKYRVGDKVVHDDFGEGVVLSISLDRKTGTIAFAYPFMTKTLALSFPKLHKKGE